MCACFLPHTFPLGAMMSASVPSIISRSVPCHSSIFTSTVSPRPWISRSRRNWIFGTTGQLEGREGKTMPHILQTQSTGEVQASPSGGRIAPSGIFMLHHFTTSRRCKANPSHLSFGLFRRILHPKHRCRVKPNPSHIPAIDFAATSFPSRRWKHHAPTQFLTSNGARCHS